MHRLGRVALVTDRRREQAAEWRLGGGMAQAVEIGHSTRHPRPHLPDERRIPREPPILGDEIEKLAVRIVLGHRIRATRIHATRYLPVRILVAGIPDDEI